MIKAHYPGRFVTIEGPDASGKSTSVNDLKNYFLHPDKYQAPSTRLTNIINNIHARFNGIVFMCEPGGTPVNDEIRNIILSPHDEPLYSRTQVFLFAANRYQNMREIVIPALKANKLVICDRFLLSTLAYQTKLEYQPLSQQLRQIDEILAIHKFALEDTTTFDSKSGVHEYITPDTTILFDVDTDTIKQRMLNRQSVNANDIDVNDEAILNDVNRVNTLRNRYQIIYDLSIDNQSPWLTDIYRIDANQEQIDRLTQICEILHKTLKL